MALYCMSAQNLPLASGSEHFHPKIGYLESFPMVRKHRMDTI